MSYLMDELSKHGMKCYLDKKFAFTSAKPDMLSFLPNRIFFLSLQQKKSSMEMKLLTLQG